MYNTTLVWQANSSEENHKFMCAIIIPLVDWLFVFSSRIKPGTSWSSKLAAQQPAHCSCEPRTAHPRTPPLLFHQLYFQFQIFLQRRDGHAASDLLATCTPLCSSNWFHSENFNWVSYISNFEILILFSRGSSLTSLCIVFLITYYLPGSLVSATFWTYWVFPRRFKK